MVETGRVSEQYLVPGVPLGPAARFFERFTLSENDTRLHYTLVIDDPSSLTKPTEQKRSWVVSDEEVLPFNCTSSDGAQR